MNQLYVLRLPNKLGKYQEEATFKKNIVDPTWAVYYMRGDWLVAILPPINGRLRVTCRCAGGLYQLSKLYHLIGRHIPLVSHPHCEKITRISNTIHVLHSYNKKLFHN